MEHCNHHNECIPNAETQAAMLRAREMVGKFETFDELMADIEKKSLET